MKYYKKIVDTNPDVKPNSFLIIAPFVKSNYIMIDLNNLINLYW